MKNKFSRYALTLCFVSVLFTSCKKDDDDDNNPPVTDITFLSQNFTVSQTNPYEHYFVTGGAVIQGIVNSGPAPYFYLSGGTRMLNTTGNQTRFLNVGDVVNGSSTTWSTTDGPSTMSNADFGQGVKYVGFYYNSNGALHYGWMKLNFTGTDTFIIVELAYNNTAGESINVGQH